MANSLTRDEKYMKEAMKEARKAEALGEVPIGCVIVYEDIRSVAYEGVGCVSFCVVKCVSFL